MFLMATRLRNYRRACGKFNACGGGVRQKKPEADFAAFNEAGNLTRESGNPPLQPWGGCKSGTYV